MKKRPGAHRRKHAPRELGDPFAEGQDAAARGCAEEENPYGPEEEDERALWRDGWRDAKADRTAAV